MRKPPKRSVTINALRGEGAPLDFTGKSKKKVLVVNTANTPTVVNEGGQAIGGHQRAYVSPKDKVAQGAIRIGLLRVLSE